MAEIGIFVHDLGSREIRVLFDVPVAEAESFTYLMTSSGGYVPMISNVSFYDADMMSVKITFEMALTNGQSYNLQVVDGSPVTTTPFTFMATDRDGPRILGAFQSLRGCVDVVCDRIVAPTSMSAVANLVAPAGSVPMSIVVPTPGQSLNVVRFRFGSAPADSEFSIQYSNITDVPQNPCVAGEVPLTLAYDVNPASAFADLTRARAVFAQVADVNNADGFSTATIRVFFNCPMLATDVLDDLKWAVEQDSTSLGFSDAYDPVGRIVNFASTANAPFVTDQHTWFVDLHVGSNSTAYPFKISFDALLHPIRSEDGMSTVPTGFIMANPVVAPPGVMSISSSLRGAVVRADCNIKTWEEDATLLVDTPNVSTTIAVGSSGFSLPQPTVNVVSTINFPPAGSLWIATSDGMVRVDYTGTSGTDSFIGCTGGTGVMGIGGTVDSITVAATPHAAVSLSSSLPTMLWAFNNILHAYSVHIGDPSLFPFLAAGHEALDTVNTVDPGDYATTMNLSTLITKANVFKAKLTAHMTSETFHYGQDVGVDSIDAFDTASLINLLSDLRDRVTRHNLSALYPRSFGFPEAGMIPSYPMFHSFPGVGTISASLKDLIVVSLDGGLNGSTLTLDVPISKSWRNNHLGIVDKISYGKIRDGFTVVDSFPVMTSAVARPGYSLTVQGPYLLSDIVQLYLSKPMRKQVLTIGTNITIVGGSLSATDAGWLNDRTIFVQVSNMADIPYFISCPADLVSGLRDVAGNLID